MQRGRGYLPRFFKERTDNMLHFIDFEVFHADWLCVILSPTHKTKTVIVNDRDKLKAYYDKYKKEIFVGYNIRHYDQYIFKAILIGFDPKDVNDSIIVKGVKGWEYSDLFRNIELNFYDARPEEGNSPGLKTLEGYLGNNIEESSVDFNLQRKLTPAEIAETVKYCQHDVEQTMQVFMINKDDFQTRMDLINEFKRPLDELGKSQTQQTALVLGAVKQERKDEFDIEFPPCLQLDKYKSIAMWYLNPENWYKRLPSKKVDKATRKSQKVIVADTPHEFGWGGIHGAKLNYIESGQFLNMDVSSYYPSIMIEYDWLSRNVKNKGQYRGIKDTRIVLKAKKEKRQSSYKLVLNKTYGGSNDPHNALFDPRQANNVCVGGQLLLLDLIEKLEPYCDIIQSNTDGILVKLHDNREQVENICREWMNRTGMVLEFDEFIKVIQRDVNNYILIPSGSLYDEKGKPRWKSKGRFLKKHTPLDYNLPIIQEAVINYFIHGIPVKDTINRCNELIKFQQIVKVSSSYDFAMHGIHRLTAKTLRVFASKNLTDGGVYKVKEGCNPEKFEYTSINCFIENGQVKGKTVPDNLDRDFYITLAQAQIDKFLYGKD